jgi:hypothetical protein
MERPARGTVEGDVEKLRASHDLLRRAAVELGASPEKAVRDSDVKRRILDLDPEWDESELGFGKFSRFLRQAHDAEVINLRKLENGSYELTLPGPESAEASEMAEAEPAPRTRGRDRRDRKREPEKPAEYAAAPSAERKTPTAPPPAPAAEKKAEPMPEPAPAVAPKAAERPAPKAEPPLAPAAPEARPRASGLSLGRRGSRGRLLAEPPPLLEGQLVGARPKPAPATQIEADLESGAKAGFDPGTLGLPAEPAAVLAHISSYHGIGPRSAETFANSVGAKNVFAVLHSDAGRVLEILGARRGEKLLAAWREDAAARLSSVRAAAEVPPTSGKAQGETRSRGRRGGRRRGPRKTPSGASE